MVWELNGFVMVISIGNCKYPGHETGGKWFLIYRVWKARRVELMLAVGEVRARATMTVAEMTPLRLWSTRSRRDRCIGPPNQKTWVCSWPGLATHKPQKIANSCYGVMDNRILPLAVYTSIGKWKEKRRQRSNVFWVLSFLLESGDVKRFHVRRFKPNIQKSIWWKTLLFILIFFLIFQFSYIRFHLILLTFIFSFIAKRKLL